MRQTSQDGFTLIEVIAALAILAGAVAACYVGLSNSWRAQRAASRHMQVLQLAQNQIAIASLQPVLADGQSSAGEDSGISWQITIRQHPNAATPTDAPVPSAFWIVFEAQWNDRSHRDQQTFQMRSLKLVADQP